MSSTDHLANAREYIAIAESADAKSEAYARAADEIIAWLAEDLTRTQRQVSAALERSQSWVSDLVRWRTSDRDRDQRTPFSGEQENTARYERQAKTVLKDPERRQTALAQLPTGQIEEVIQEAHGVVMDRLHAKQAERDTTPKEPTVRDLMGGERFDPSESWADTHIIRVQEKAHFLRRQVEKWGLVLGSLSEEEAFEMLQETERNVAEVRAALQERLRDRGRTEV